MDDKVPTTVEEVKEKLRQIVPGHAGIAACLIGVFECEMGMGKPLLKAYEAALYAYIENTESKHLVPKR